jgi:hypothetical protein
MTHISEILAARVVAEFAEMDALDEATKLQPRRQRRQTGPSIVYSIRLDPAEVAALEAQAAAAHIKPTALARNLIRCGLATQTGEEVARAVDRLESAVAELRALVP